MTNVSLSAETWHGILREIKGRKLKLQVLNLLSVSLVDIETLVKEWTLVIEKKGKIISIGKETDQESKLIRAFSREKERRELYWLVFRLMYRGAPLRKTCSRLGIEQGTVLRIKRDVAKSKQLLWLLSTFIMTIIGLKVAQSYSDNWLMQVIICGFATVSIMYFTYSDSKEL